MSENGARILIVDDDAFLGEALKEGVNRVGHEAVLVTRPEEGLVLMQGSSFDFALVDCLLPQMTGLEFIERARQKSKTPFRSLLMSGIYTDKAFVQEALQKTQSVAFLKKPFDLSDLLKLLQKEVVKKTERPSKVHIYKNFARATVSLKEKKNLLESLQEVSGYDLPLVYQLLSETKSSGFLSIYHADGSVSSVTFSSGLIISVEIEDKTTALGEMLIQGGFISGEDLQVSLKEKSKKRLGARMVDSNLLSPHALDLMMTEQMNIRLSRTISMNRLKLNFANSETELIQPAIDSDQMLVYLHDWVASKLSINWLKSLYFKWLGYPIALHANFKANHPAFQMSLLQALEGLEEQLRSGTSLGRLLATQGYQEIAVFKGIHFLLLRGLIHFNQSEAVRPPAELLGYLRTLRSQLQGKGPADIGDLLGFGEDADAQKNAQDLIASLGPKPKDPQSETARLWQELTHLLSKVSAKPQIPGSDKEANEKKEPIDEAEGILKANQLIEQVKKDLNYNQYLKAAEKLEAALSLAANVYQAHLYRAWIQLGTLNPRKISEGIKEVEMELMQVPPDERYDALYPFVVGLFLKAQGDFVGAKKSFQRALSLDSSFLVARREMGNLDSQPRAKQDIFNMDLRQVMSGLFKKK